MCNLSAVFEKKSQEMLLIELVQDGLIQLTDAAKKAGLTPAEFEELMKKSK